MSLSVGMVDISKAVIFLTGPLDEELEDGGAFFLSLILRSLYVSIWK